MELKENKINPGPSDDYLIGLIGFNKNTRDVFIKYFVNPLKRIAKEILLPRICLYLPEIFYKKYLNLSKEEIKDACLAAYIQIMDKEEFEHCNTIKELYKLAYKVSKNNILNIIKEKKKCKSIEETAEKAGIDEAGYLDFIVSQEDCSDIENQTDYELIKKELPWDLFEIMKMKKSGFKIKEIAGKMELSERTIKRKLKQVEEYALALLNGEVPPLKKGQKKIVKN